MLQLVFFNLKVKERRGNGANALQACLQRILFLTNQLRFLGHLRSWDHPRKHELVQREGHQDAGPTCGSTNAR